MEDIDIYIEEEVDVTITVDENTAYVIEVPGVSAASILTTKGDLLGYSTLPERHPVGTDGYVLTADSSETRGIKWSAPPANNIIEQGNSSVEVVDTAAGVITINTDTHDIMTFQTLHQPITVSHADSFLDANTPLMLVKTTGATSGKGAVLWVTTGRNAATTDVDVFRVANSVGEIFSVDNGGAISVNSGNRVNEFSTDTTLGGNSDLALPTEKAVKTYVNTQIATIDVLTTKGDLHTFSTVDARLPVGIDGYVLTADSSQATGLKWASGGGGGSGDKIEEGDSSVEVVDAGTGEIINTVDGDEMLTIKNSGVYVNDNGDYASTTYLDLKSNAAALFSCTTQSASNAATFQCVKTRGSIGSPAAVADGDTLGLFQFRTYDGTNNQWTAQIYAEVDGAVSANTVPTAFSFWTTATNTAARASRLVIEPGGNTRPGADDTYDLGTSSYRWDDIYATNATIQTSDARSKEDITDNKLGLDFINDLKTVSFKWKNYTYKDKKRIPSKENEGSFDEFEVVKEKKFSRKHTGLLAQDVDIVLKKHNIKTKDFAGFVYDSKTDKYGLRYNEFIAPLIKSVQELSAENKELKHRVIDLETQHELLLKRIEALEAK